MTDYKNRVYIPEPKRTLGSLFLDVIAALAIIGAVIIVLGALADRDEAIARAEAAEQKAAKLSAASDLKPAEVCRIFGGQTYCYRKYKGM